MADEKINSTANNIKINIDNLSYVDYLWTQRTSDNAIQGIRLDRRNLPLNLSADKLGGKDPSYYLNYNNLTNKPTIPTVNNGTLTIQKNGTNVATFTANQSNNVTANISVPTKTSDLTNDSQYVKNGDILVPGSGYSYVYNGQLDDALWSAAKRYYIICSIHPITVNGVTYPHTDSTKTIADDDYIVDSAPTKIYNSIDDPSLNRLFDGSTDTHFVETSGANYIKIRIIPLATRQDNYSPAASTNSFAGYPYGWFAVSTYWGAAASRVQYATYNKHSSWPTGWAIVEGTKVNNNKLTWRIQDINNYTRTVMDFWFIGDGDSSHWLRPTAIYWIKNRVTNIDTENSYFSKYVDETLTTNVTWNWHGTQTAKITAETGTGEFKTIYENGTSLVNKYAAKSHTHNYAGSDSAGGAANSVKKNLTIGGVIYNGSTAVNIPYGSGIMAISSTTSTPGTISQLSRADHIHKIDLATGDSNGQVKIAGTNIDVKGLGSAAYTNSNDYATPDWTKEHWAKEINTQDVRIWGLDQGIYKLTYGMDSTTPKDHIVNIYYNGETGTEKKSISPTPLYLYVDAVNATAATRLTSWRLYLHSGTIFKGRTNSKSGTIEQGWAISYITKLNGATTANTIYAPTTSGTSGQILQSNGDGTAPTWIDIPIRTYEGPTYGTCYTIDAPNGNYSMQIGDSGFTVDSSTPDGQPSNILQVNENTFIYNDSETVLHTGNATKMASFYAHSANSYVDIRTNQGSSTTNGITIIERGQVSLAGVTNLSLAHSMPNTNYALFFTEVHASANTVYTPIIRSKTTTGFSVYLGSGGIIYDYVAIYVG